jgi:hypothetical protein
MTGLLMAGVCGMAVVKCVKACLSVRLLEKDREAWAMWEKAVQEKHRHREMLIGNAVLQVIRFISSFVGKKGDR